MTTTTLGLQEIMGRVALQLTQTLAALNNDDPGSEVVLWGKKHRGKTFETVFNTDPHYVLWFMRHVRADTTSQEQGRFVQYCQKRVTDGQATVDGNEAVKANSLDDKDTSKNAAAPKFKKDDNESDPLDMLQEPEDGDLQDIKGAVEGLEGQLQNLVVIVAHLNELVLAIKKP